MNKGIIKCLKNSIAEKGNYCYSLPVETTKAVIKELNRLNNIITKLEKWLEERTYGMNEIHTYKIGALEDEVILNKLKALKENK